MNCLALEECSRPQIDSHDIARAEPPLAQNAILLDIHHAHFGGHDDQAVLAGEIARGAQAVAIQGGPYDAPVGENHRRGTVPRLHQTGMVFEECPLLVRELLVFLPRGRHQHRHAMGQIPSRHGKKLYGIVQTCRVAHSLLNQWLQPGRSRQLG